MEMKAKIDCVSEVFDTMFSCFKSEINNGIANVDTKEAGEVMDIIKDLSETEKNLREACYYKLVSEAMENTESEKYGYKWSQKPYIDAYVRDPEEFRDNMATGYNGKMGYVDWNGTKSEYGTSYDGYKDAKRHYTETKSQSDKEKMDMYADEHVKKAITTLKEMWADADSTHKARMKTELSALINNMV